MRYLTLISILVVVLTGCKSEVAISNNDSTIPLLTEKVELLTAVEINEAQSPSIIKEEPYLYIENLVSKEDGKRVVIVESNVDMDQKSLEQALEKSLIKSNPDVDLRYTLEWASPKFLLIRFWLLDTDVFSFMFNLDKATTIDGDVFKNKDQPHRNQLQVLYKGDQPSITTVYGISSSPDGKKIAVLYAHDKSIGPSADLVILNNKGKIIDTYENAAYVSHSDGFLFEYPLSWLDSTQLILPADINEDNLTGKVLFNLEDQQFTINKDERISDQMIEDIFVYTNDRDYSYLYSLKWSLDGRLVAFQASSNQIWVYDLELRTFEFMGIGKLLGWLSDGNLVYLNSQDQVIIF
ncbi:MAG TPA: hypothetical protein IAA29_18365 [Candidatus Paenibacillus intestinavium]|nr:hypothetical protein [Candidatus Paenibacillus intestinavium]